VHSKRLLVFHLALSSLSLFDNKSKKRVVGRMREVCEKLCGIKTFSFENSQQKSLNPAADINIRNAPLVSRAKLSMLLILTSPGPVSSLGVVNRVVKLWFCSVNVKNPQQSSVMVDRTQHVPQLHDQEKICV